MNRTIISLALHRSHHECSQQAQSVEQYEAPASVKNERGKWEKIIWQGGVCYGTWLALIGSACNGLKLASS